MNPKKIDDFLADSGGWAYIDIQGTEQWYEEQRKRYLWYRNNLGANMVSFYNPRVEEDYDRAKHYVAHFREGVTRISVSQPVDGATFMAYWTLAELSIEVLDHELDVLYSMMASGLVQLMKALPTAQYKGIIARLNKEIPALRDLLKSVEKEATEAGYQLAWSTTYTVLSNMLPAAKWTSVALKAIGSGVQIYLDEELGGDKSSEAMEALDAGLDFGVSPTLVAIEALETKVKDSKTALAARVQKAGKVAKAGAPIGDLLGLACDVDEFLATRDKADKVRKAVDKAVADLAKALNDLEDANRASWKFRQGARMKLAEAERKMEEYIDYAEELREQVWDLEYQDGIDEWDTPVWSKTARVV